MPEPAHGFTEDLLHWIWQSQHIDQDRLQTTDGKAVTIIRPGMHNHSDGPDFLNAELHIGPLKWYGDIEIHWHEQDWNRHGHHSDPNYNRVILHVVYESGHPGPVLRSDGTSMPILALKPCLSNPLQSFLNSYTRQESLPCSGHISFLSENAFIRQLDKAHKAYFEQKVNDLLTFYESTLPPSRAWRALLTKGLFDGLGISYNRAPMRALHERLSSLTTSHLSRNRLAEKALCLSGILDAEEPSPFSWKHKGCRPANHPEHRIQQAAACMWFINRLPFEQWLSGSPTALWLELNAHIDTNPGLGKQRGQILFGTVWLPSFFILGTLFASKKIQSSAYESWMNHQIKLPEALLKALKSLPLPPELYNRKLGAVYQSRAHCLPRNCSDCEVFKSIISS